jgi:signal transduction histidine kinase
MFYNGQRNQGEIQNGLGLGLKIAKSVAENHKGCVGFESRPTQGTRFWLELPLIVE